MRLPDRRRAVERRPPGLQLRYGMRLRCGRAGVPLPGVADQQEPPDAAASGALDLTLFGEATRNSSRRSRLPVCYGLGVATNGKQALLCQAADLIGRDRLASGLKISAALLDSWISGRASMPDRKLSALADLLEEISNSPEQ